MLCTAGDPLSRLPAAGGAPLCSCCFWEHPSHRAPRSAPPCTPQEAAAAATGHAKQFEMLARTSDEALRSVQADHERFKQEAAAR
jgi:hypothetical protein